MTIAACYAGLARLLDYPMDGEEVRFAHDAVGSFLRDAGNGSPTAPFAEFAAASSLAELQEEYVATFDFNPATAPYLGHHLFGDNRKKGAYLIGLKEEFGRHGFIPTGHELPDHLAVLLAFLAHLAGRGDDAARREFIAAHVLPGVQRLSAAFALRRHSPWQSVVAAAEELCTADCSAEPHTAYREAHGHSQTTAQQEVTSC